VSRVYALLTAALIASVFGQWAGAATSDRRLTFAYAAFACVALVAAAVFANVKAWRARRYPRSERDAALMPSSAHAIAEMNARLIGTAYAWGGASMLAVYQLSGLKWQHGWQYGCGMALVALGAFLYARQLAVEGKQSEPPPLHANATRLTALHAFAVAAGLLWLFFSGKLATPKPDWAANAVFVAGGIALVFLSDIAVAMQARLGRGK
jgi:hypothetical protein